MESRILFQEEQKFTQWWLWLILLAPVGIVFYNLLRPIIENSSYSQANAVSAILSKDLWIPLILFLLILILFLILKLKTTINKESISIRYFPLFSKTWKWNDIETAELITYGFVGYGIRISLKHGMVYNVKGNKGLALLFKDGKKVVIGTQKPEELEKIFRGILK